MTKEGNRRFSVHFTEEFNRCLDEIQVFFAEQGEDVLEWWFTKGLMKLIVCYLLFHISESQLKRDPLRIK